MFSPISDGVGVVCTSFPSDTQFKHIGCTYHGLVSLVLGVPLGVKLTEPMFTVVGGGKNTAHLVLPGNVRCIAPAYPYDYWRVLNSRHEGSEKRS